MAKAGEKIQYLQNTVADLIFLGSRTDTEEEISFIGWDLISLEPRNPKSNEAFQNSDAKLKKFDLSWKGLIRKYRVEEISRYTNNMLSDQLCLIYAF